MDAVGAAANIAQLIILACEVAGRTADFCSSAKEQPKASRNLAIQLPAVIEICERYHKLSKPEIDNSHLADVLDECTQHVRDLNDLLGKLLPKEGDSLAIKGWKAAKSIALDKKVEQCSQKLETFKTLLSLELGLMTYEATVKENGDNDKPQIEIAHHHHLPTGRVGRFLGRVEFLSRIDDALRPAGSSAPKVCVLLGLGGQGKTSLAFEYCRRETERAYFGSIMWFDATSRATVQMRFAQIADKLCDHQRRFENPEAAIHHVSSTLSSLGSPWLFVLDNYDRVESFRGILSLLPDVPNGSVLITSRHSGCASLGTCIPLTGMAEPEAVELLLERAAIKPTPETETEARTVVALLGYLPLAIDQTTAYIRSRKISLGEFVRHYNKRKDRIIAFKPTVSDYYRMRTDTLDHSSEPESLSVWTTWEMSFDQIKTSDSGLDPHHLRHFLSTLAFFNKLDIGMDMFQAHYEENPSPPSWMEIFVDSDYPEWDKYSYQDAVSFLEQLSLIQCHQKSDKHTEAGSPYVSLHPLVRDWIQLRLPSKERRDHCVEALRILRHYISAGQRRSDWPLVARRALLSHLNAALYFQVQFIKSWDDPRHADLGDCLRTFVGFYADHGRYTEAEQTCQRLLDCVTNKPNTKSEEIISAQILLSVIHFQQGRYSDVEKNMLRCNELVAPSWPLPIRIGLRKTLGRCYFKQGRYDEATSHFTWALNEQLTEHRSTDPDVLDIKESLAQIYRNQGNHKQATAIYKSVLQDCEPENPRIWRVKVNLANNYRAMNLFSQAAEL
ncbi:hypothetical protein QBC37DRAFT_416094 [Rhypophila decipiens]|uniref:NB-ARC domain-containing protein n=1 Tax=Rhypophila decipiens TaxID=261697 RepID=A0AAN7BB29_9PEZI|nr:hypothetical protein QBC37DRAFT_416094 [Rhypophila decipiens]